MCTGSHDAHARHDAHAHHDDLAAATLPRPADGAAVDPVRLEPVDEVVITTLVDNSFDMLLADLGPARRARRASIPPVDAPQYEEGTTTPGLLAEHGFAALVTLHRGETSHTVLFDTGISPDGLSTNLRRLDIDVASIEAVILSHGHFDHTGGLCGLARLYGRSGLPLTLHPAAWTRRRLRIPGAEPMELPTLSRRSLEGEGFSLVERRYPSVLLDGALLITGEIDRTTEFEQGLPGHEAAGADGWRPDPLVLDDQALVVEVRGRGIVVLTGCGHAGAVNICRHALRLCGTSQLCALLGGLHLTGAAFEPIIEPTVSALGELAPELVVPAHCTGWKAQHRLAGALPEAFVPNAVGTSYTLRAA